MVRNRRSWREAAIIGTEGAGARPGKLAAPEQSRLFPSPGVKRYERDYDRTAQFALRKAVHDLGYSALVDAASGELRHSAIESCPQNAPLNKELVCL
jgi:hypothetical protein